MIAYRMLAWQKPPEFVEVPVPRPGVGQVLLRTAGVGLCHSDLLFMDEPEGRFPYPMPFTLGHEIAGTVETVGPETVGVEPGDAVLVASKAACGRCSYCIRGLDNYCDATPTGLGYGVDGGLAEFVLAPARSLVPLGGIDPAAAAPLTDAGKTSYHAVKMVLDKLTPDSTVLVLGLGGLGGYGVQYIQLLSKARLIAADIAPHRLELARQVGVEEAILSDGSLRAHVMQLTGGRGVDVVIDFVGSAETIPLAQSVLRAVGALVIVGAGGGSAEVSWTTIPRECTVVIPLGGTLRDLVEVVALADRGLIRMQNDYFPFDGTPEAYAKLRTGELEGRAVVTFPVRA